MICFPFWGSQNWNGRPRLFSKFMIFATELEASPHSACIIAEGHKKKSSACDPSPYLEHTTPGSLCCLPNKALWALAARCNLIQWQTHTHTPGQTHISHSPVTLTSHSAPAPAATGSSLNCTASTTCWPALTRRCSPNTSSPKHQSPLLPPTDKSQNCHLPRLSALYYLQKVPFPSSLWMVRISPKWQSVISDRQMELFPFSLSPSLSTVRRAGGSIRGGGGWETGECGFSARPRAVWKGGGVQGRGVCVCVCVCVSVGSVAG